MILPKELEELRSWVRGFVEAEVRPVALELDAGPKDQFPWEIVSKGGRIGLLSIIIPEHLGGGPYHGLLGGAIIMEELARGCSGVATIFGAHALGILPLLLSGDLSAWEKWLPPVLEAAGKDRPLLFAFAITEPEAGSDVEDTWGSRAASLSTFARRVPGGYVINGRKVFISNGSVASFVTVFAALEREEGISSWTCFVVPAATPGFGVGQVFEKMGQRACPAAELVFEDCFVPEENRVGEEGEGWQLARLTLAASRGPVGAIAVGIAQDAYERAYSYARERRQGGVPIIRHQMVAALLADMAIQIEAARQLVYHACQLADTVSPPPLGPASMAKVFASDVAVRVATDAIQVLGGYGYMREYGVEKCLRDAKLTQIYEGTNQICRLAVLESLASGELPLRP